MKTNDLKCYLCCLLEFDIPFFRHVYCLRWQNLELVVIFRTELQFIPEEMALFVHFPKTASMFSLFYANEVLALMSQLSFGFKFKIAKFFASLLRFVHELLLRLLMSLHSLVHLSDCLNGIQRRARMTKV